MIIILIISAVVVLGVIGWWQWALAEERHEIERQWRRDHA